MSRPVLKKREEKHLIFIDNNFVNTGQPDDRAPKPQSASGKPAGEFAETGVTTKKAPGRSGQGLFDDRWLRGTQYPILAIGRTGNSQARGVASFLRYAATAPLWSQTAWMAAPSLLSTRVGAVASIGDEIFTVTHHYPGRSVELHFFACTLLGDPTPLLGQEMRWVPRADLCNLQFPPADDELIRLLTGATKKQETRRSGDHE